MERKVTANQRRKRRRKGTSSTTPPQRTMEDAELMKVAAFKLQESANRLEMLAKEARSSKLRTHLHSLSRELASYENQLYELIETNSTTGGVPTTTPAGGRERTKKLLQFRR